MIILNEKRPAILDKSEPIEVDSIVEQSGGALLKSFRAIGAEVDATLDTSLFEGSLDAYRGLTINMGLFHPEDPNKDITLSVDNWVIDSSWDGSTLSGSLKVEDGVSPRKFSAGIKMKPGKSNAGANINDLLKKCDADHLWSLGYPLARRNVENFLPIYLETLDLLVQIKFNDTLGVNWNRAIEKYVLYYNPVFVLESAIIDYLYDKSEGNTNFSSFEDRYIYGLTFMLIHELEHVVRHNVVSSDSLRMLDQVSDDQLGHEINNGITDTFININTRNVLNRALRKGDSVGVTVGYGNEAFFASWPIIGQVGGAGIYKAFNNGFSNMKSTADVAKGVVSLYSKIMQIDNDMKNISFDSHDLSDYISQPMVLMFACSDIYTLFGNNSANFTNFCVGAIKSLTKPVNFEEMGYTKSKIEKVEKSKEEEQKQEVVEKEAELIGEIVKDKLTGRRGFITDYDKENGKINIFYPEDQAVIKDILGY